MVEDEADGIQKMAENSTGLYEWQGVICKFALNRNEMSGLV